ncbi:Protection of telomeres protein 1 [Pseudozyma hubeiensis]|nr:Protection of telomeres protein 1 [Pseudozyma hubeiensis]
MKLAPIRTLLSSSSLNLPYRPACLPNMPRKRKGPKREHSEGEHTPAPPPRSSDAATLTANTASTHPSTMERQHTTELAVNTTHKRARYLTEAEEDRLGKLVRLERWIESVGHGRGAAFCVCGHLVKADPPTGSTSANTFSIELSCIQPNDPSTRSHLVATFHGELATKVSEPLLLLHRLGPPAVVYLSGFAADISYASQAPPRVSFAHQRAVLKMSPQPPSSDPTAPTSAIWIEHLATPPTASLNNTTSTTTVPAVSESHSQQRSPQPQPQAERASTTHPEPSPPSQLSDWFSTPAPTTNAGAQPVPVATTAAASLVSMPPPPPQQMQPSRASASALAIKSESQPAASTSRATSRQTSTAPPPQQRRNAPNVKPRRMGNCLYTPMSMVRDGERASIIGVVMSAGDPRRSTSGTRDLSIKITIADASCISGTGYAKELARSMTVMLFAQQAERIPHNIAPGHIIAVRSVQIQMFSNKPQAVGKSAAQWSWATYDPVSGDVRASSNFPLASHTPPECSADEMEHFRDMANWFSELQGVDANIVTRSSRPTLKLRDVGENTFFDTVVEVLKVYTHTLAPDLYVTDYTNHTLFFRGNDKYLRVESTIPYPDDTDGWGHVFQISLWDSHATIAEGLQTGDIIRIQNVRPKLNPRGLLTGGLGSSTDSGIKIRTLKPTDEARIDLEQRRARFMETLMTAEEEAFADRAEREYSQSSQPAQVNGRQAQHDEQRTDAVLEAVAGSLPPEPNPISAARSGGAPHASPNTANDQTAAPNTSAVPLESASRTTNPVDPTARVESAAATGASPMSSTQPPFPTPAQRQIRATQQATPSRSIDRATSIPLGASVSGNGNRSQDDLSLVETPDLKPGLLMGPPGATLGERRPLLRCNAPASIPLTALASLPTTSLCPGMFKVKARIISTNPAKVEQWGRVECNACKRVLPLDQRFCVKCGDEEGESLSHCFRFAIMLEEVDSELVARKQQHGGSGETGAKRTAIPMLFHGRSAEVLLPCVDAKALYNGERSSIKTLKRFHNRLLRPDEYGLEAEQVLAVYSYPSNEAGRTVRRFAALKELNCLYSPRDLL